MNRKLSSDGKILYAWYLLFIIFINFLFAQFRIGEKLTIDCERCTLTKVSRSKLSRVSSSRDHTYLAQFFVIFLRSGGRRLWPKKKLSTVCSNPFRITSQARGICIRTRIRGITLLLHGSDFTSLFSRLLAFCCNGIYNTYSGAQKYSVIP